MDTRVLEVISSQIDDQVTAIQEHLGNGLAEDYAAYRELCGKHHGLLLAKRIIKDLQRNLENDEDE
jgi:hypothetical protein